jgi:hypothetical protein
LGIEPCGAPDGSEEFSDKTQYVEERIIRRIDHCITGLTACKLS